jgi:hypothetical protein
VGWQVKKQLPAVESENLMTAGFVFKGWRRYNGGHG